MVVKFICARDHTPHVARGRKTLQTYGFPVHTYGKHNLFKGVNQKPGSNKFMSISHSACSYKNYGLKYFPELQTLDYFNYLNFFYFMCNFKSFFKAKPL